jgi:hypothetical protein
MNTRILWGITFALALVVLRASAFARQARNLNELIQTGGRVAGLGRFRPTFSR